VSDALARLAFRLSSGGLPPLVLMTDDARLPDPLAAAQRLPGGSLIVLRDRDPARRKALAQALARIARQRGLYLLIAGDPKLAATADGLHVAEKDMRLIAHWRARRPDLFMTAAAHSLRAAVAAATCGADAVFLSPVFSTRSHPGRPALGAMRLRRIAQLVPVPVYALGGIDAGTARQIADAPIAGFAAIGALDFRREI
jgi:thiamine-phosphate pyrophosphorylase